MESTSYKIMDSYIRMPSLDYTTNYYLIFIISFWQIVLLPHLPLLLLLFNQ